MTTLAPAAQLSDAAIAQAFREVADDAKGSGHFDDFIWRVEGKARALDHSATREGDLFRVGDMDGGYSYFHTRAEALAHGHDPVAYVLAAQPTSGEVGKCCSNAGTFACNCNTFKPTPAAGAVGEADMVRAWADRNNIVGDYLIHAFRDAVATARTGGGAEPFAWYLRGEDGKPAFAPYYRKADAEGMIDWYAQRPDEEQFTLHELFTRELPVAGDGGRDAAFRKWIGAIAGEDLEGYAPERQAFYGGWKAALTTGQGDAGGGA